MRSDGVQWLEAAGDLASDGSLRLTGLNVTVDGSYVAPTPVWTGGDAVTETCQDWTSASTTDQGSTTTTDGVGDALGGTRPVDCSRALPLLCLEE